MCHMFRATCCMSPVTYNLSLMPTATATFHPPANSPTMHSRLVCKDQKKTKNAKNQLSLLKIKLSSRYPILAIVSLTRGLQSTRKCGFQEGTTYVIQHTTFGHCNLQTELATWQISGNVQIAIYCQLNCESIPLPILSRYLPILP